MPTKPARRGMALHNPVKPEKKPVVLFPGGRLKPLSVSIPECLDSWIAPGVDCRDEAAPRGFPFTGGKAPRKSPDGSRLARPVATAKRNTCPQIRRAR